MDETCTTFVRSTIGTGISLSTTTNRSATPSIDRPRRPCRLRCIDQKICISTSGARTPRSGYLFGGAGPSAYRKRRQSPAGGHDRRSHWHPPAFTTLPTALRARPSTRYLTFSLKCDANCSAAKSIFLRGYADSSAIIVGPLRLSGTGY
jgi:hypothetical protein